ncbi:hypothetical protein GCM10010384_22420 [Streptomyces djakartensis]|uniref:Transposase DDE domain-containing protein n=1 Tax=Streptomyces djakartensis TaxID=68193 RepID=A0ABQ2ZJI4_9ACTN|nr:hypothetical protein GCM10010384_22420 [Streptomyces djakartensis]
MLMQTWLSIKGCKQPDQKSFGSGWRRRGRQRSCGEPECRMDVLTWDVVRIVNRLAGWRKQLTSLRTLLTTLAETFPCVTQIALASMA